MDDLKNVPQNPVQGNKKWSGFRIGGEIPSSPECRRTKHNPEVFQPGNQYFPTGEKKPEADKDLYVGDDTCRFPIKKSEKKRKK